MNQKATLSVVRLFLCVIIFVSLVAYFFICAPNREWHGFGVDSQEYVYIGKQNEIHVYCRGEQIASIPIPSFRTYYMTVLQDDTILLSSSQNVYVFDLGGTQLSCEPDLRSSVYNELRHLKTAETGSDTFNLQSDILGKHSVTDKHGTVLFSESESLRFIDLAIPRVLLFSAVALMFSFIADLFFIRKNTYPSES